MKLKENVIVVSSKGVAQDNRGRKWTKQMGLRLIVSCDKEKGEEIKPSRQNHLSQKSKKDSDSSCHITASGKVSQYQIWALNGFHSDVGTLLTGNKMSASSAFE